MRGLRWTCGLPMQDTTTVPPVPIPPPDIASLSLEDGIPASTVPGTQPSEPPPSPHPAAEYFAAPTWNGHLLTLEFNEKYLEFIKKSEKRIAYQLAYLYICDLNPLLSVFFVEKINEKDLLIISDSEDNPVYCQFAFNILKAQIQTSKTLVDNIKAHDIETNILILCHDFPTDFEVETKIRRFVENGGILLSFQTASALIDKLWPGLIKYKNGLTTVEKQIEIEVLPDDDDTPLFSMFRAAQQHKQIFRRDGLQRFVSRNPDIVTTLMKEKGPTETALAVRFERGSGVVYHLSVPWLGTYHLINPELRQESKKLLPKEIAAKLLKQLSNERLPTAINAWRLAHSCGFFNAMTEGITLIPSLHTTLELVYKLLQRRMS